jgi:branched-chain amino acid transport system substrate-binding protein
LSSLAKHFEERKQMKQRNFLLLALLITAALIAVACAPSAPPVEEQAAPEDPWGVIEIGPDDPVRIAVNTVTSGAGVDVLGLNELRGAEIAVADAGGQVLGHDIELVANDTLCSAEGGQTVASRTVSDPTIVAIMGHTCSSSCKPAALIYEEAHMTMISPSCTAGALTDEDAVRSFMRTAFNDNFQGKEAADFVYNTLGVRRIATIHDGSPYAVGLVDVLAANFEELGGEIVAQEAVNVGDTDMRPLLTSIAAQEPDMLYFPIFPAEAGFIAVQSGEVEGLEDVILMGADGIKTDTFIEAAGDAAEGAYASGPLTAESPEYTAFLDAYVEAYGEEPPAPYAPESYDGISIILKAIEAAAIEGDDGTLYIGRQAMRDAMYNVESFEGLSGTIECGPTGDCSTAGVEFAQVQGGEWVALDQ